MEGWPVPKTGLEQRVFAKSQPWKCIVSGHKQIVTQGEEVAAQQASITLRPAQNGDAETRASYFRAFDAEMLS